MRSTPRLHLFATKYMRDSVPRLHSRPTATARLDSVLSGRFFFCEIVSRHQGADPTILDENQTMHACVLSSAAPGADVEVAQV